MNAPPTRIIAAAMSALVFAAAASAAPTHDKTVSLRPHAAAGSGLWGNDKPAPEPTTILTVAVVDLDAKDLSGILVEIDSQRGRVEHMEAYTDAKGRATFKGLPADTYRIVAHTAGGIEWICPVVSGPTMLVLMEW